MDIRNKIVSFSNKISEKTINHTIEIFLKCGKNKCFGRTVVEEVTGLKSSGASNLIKLLLDSEEVHRLNKGINDKSIEEIEEKHGIYILETLKEFLRRSNGGELFDYAGNDI